MREGHRHLLKQQCHHTPNGGAEDGGVQDGYPVKVRGAGTFGGLPRTPDCGWSVGGQVRSRALPPSLRGPLPPR